MNTLHGSSTVRVIPTEDWHREALSAEFLNDPAFELVYVAEETFEDGFISINVCWRRSDPTHRPRKNEKRQVDTLLMRIEK